LATTTLGQNNVLRSVYDTPSESLRVNLVGSGSPSLPNVVRLSDGTDFLTSTVIGGSRALDVNIANDITLTLEHTEDSVRLGDGTIFFTSTQFGPKNALDVNFLNEGLATEDNQDITNSLLSSIDNNLSNPLTISGNVNISDLSASKDDVKIAGTEDGTVNGVIRHFVNNLRLQILDAHDRQMDITYADFGTKNERITYIIYTSPTFPGVSAVKTLNYSLVSGKYRRDSITWSII